VREVVRLAAEECAPSAREVLAGQGIPLERPVSDPLIESLQEALRSFESLAKPVGLLADISNPDFLEVYRGEGKNETGTPLQAILPKAVRLTLFAATIGDEVSREISRLFADGRFELGYLLDAVASCGADHLAARLEQSRHGRAPEGTVFLRYSPGYCGWDITGQRKLFAALRPEEIGITLRESCLMAPLKSVSGVLVAARPEAHRFKHTYPFCAACADKTCRERIATIGQELASAPASGRS